MRQPSRFLVVTSCTANLITGGGWSLFCARAHRNGWRVCALIDAVFIALRREREHCRRCAAWEARQASRLRADTDARLS